MGEKKLSDTELYAVFENCGWYEGRKEDVNGQLPIGYEEVPSGVCAFIEEFCGLRYKYEFEIEYEISGKLEKDIINTDVILYPDMGYYGELDDSGLRYYSKLIGKELYPIGMMRHSNVALDADLNMYILELGSGCMLLSSDPIEGLHKILINSLHKGVYDLVELGDGNWEWKKRRSSYDKE